MKSNKTSSEGGAQVERRWGPSLLDVAHASGDRSYRAGPLTLFGIVYFCIHLFSPAYRTAGRQVSL